MKGGIKMGTNKQSTQERHQCFIQSLQQEYSQDESTDRYTDMEKSEFDKLLEEIFDHDVFSES